MVEHVLGLSGKPDLIDQLAPHQVLQDRINPQRFQYPEGPYSSAQDFVKEWMAALLAL